MNRRELLVSFARLTGLVALGTTTGILLSRNGSGNEVCRPQPCSGCPSFTGCSLPKKAAAAKTEVDHGRV